MPSATPDPVPEADSNGAVESTLSEQEPGAGGAWSFIRELLETAFLALVIWLAVNFATARYVVVGQSMEPSLHSGQFLIIDRLSYRFGDPQPGDVVVFDYPLNTGDDYVKRIVGMPGDEVHLEAGKVYINGSPLDEPYIASDTPGDQTWTVPEGSYFVMGDNRHSSSDSRSWGMLAREYLVGKAWLSYWPPQDWGLVEQFTRQYASAAGSP